MSAKLRILMVFLGSRGDVQPGMALAYALQQRGHEVTFGTPPNMVELVSSAGINCVELGPDSKELLNSDLVQKRIKQRNPVKAFVALKELAGYGWDDLCSKLVKLAPEHDVIITGVLGQELALAAAESNALAQVALHYAPQRRSKRWAPVPHPALSRNRLVARTSWWIAEKTWRLMTRQHDDRARAMFGLAPSPAPIENRMKATGALEIQTFDPVVMPELAGEWLPQRPFVGFLDLPADVHDQLSPMDAETDAWIDAGEPPVYWGFGSMPVLDPAGAVQMITEVSRRLGVRALISSGWSDLSGVEQSDQIRIVGALNHARVLPRCRAAVHHGGAGTTAAALRSGLPALVCWFSADQPLWGNQLKILGVGESTGFKQLTTERLEAALRTVLSRETAERAVAVAAQMASADQAVQTTAELVERAGERAVIRRR